MAKTNNKKAIQEILNRKYDTSSEEKVKTTILLDRTLKKISQVYAIQNDMTLQEVIEEGLKKIVL